MTPDLGSDLFQLEAKLIEPDEIDAENQEYKARLVDLWLWMDSVAQCTPSRVTLTETANIELKNRQQAHQGVQ